MSRKEKEKGRTEEYFIHWENRKRDKKSQTTRLLSLPAMMIHSSVNSSIQTISRTDMNSTDFARGIKVDFFSLPSIPTDLPH